jgi:uncharacterized protein YbjQ (UPF0145 family)
MKCKECGESSWILSEHNLCRACVRKQKEAVQAHRSKSAFQSQAGNLVSEKNVSQQHVSDVMDILITTETTINLHVTKRIDIVMATCFCPLNMDVDEFKDDLFLHLKRAAVKVGANAVIAVNVTMISEVGASFGSANVNRYRAVAVGTAVKLDFDS